MVVSCSTLCEVVLTEQDVELLARVTRELKGYISCLEHVRLARVWGVHPCSDCVHNYVP